MRAFEPSGCPPLGSNLFSLTKKAAAAYAAAAYFLLLIQSALVFAVLGSICDNVCFKVGGELLVAGKFHREIAHTL